MVQEKVISAVADLTSKDASELNAETKFADLGIDSLDITELAMNLEDEFGIELKVDASIATIGDLVKKIESEKN